MITNKKKNIHIQTDICFNRITWDFRNELGQFGLICSAGWSLISLMLPVDHPFLTQCRAEMGGKHPENKWWICYIHSVRFPLVAGNTFPMAETDMRLGSSTTLGRCRGVPLNDTLRCHQTWPGNPIEISIVYTWRFSWENQRKNAGFSQRFSMAAMACWKIYGECSNVPMTSTIYTGYTLW